jgi:hypothetical protein
MSPSTNNMPVATNSFFGHTFYAYREDTWIFFKRHHYGRGSYGHIFSGCMMKMVPPHDTTNNLCFCSISNTGVALLQCGQPREAADVFVKGLKAIRKEMATLAPGPSSKMYHACVICHRAPESEILESFLYETSPPIMLIPSPGTNLVTVSHKLFVTALPDEEECHNEHSLPHKTKTASRGFIFSCPYTASTNASCKSLTFDHLCFMMLYNIALTYDVLAWSNNGRTNDSKDARQALSLYQLAYQVQQNNNLPISTVYLCGMLNNMARLHRSMQELNAACNCLSDLTSILIYVTTRNQVHEMLVHGEGASNPMDEQNAYYMAQFWNIVLTEGGAHSPAGAA